MDNQTCNNCYFSNPILHSYIPDIIRCRRYPPGIVPESHLSDTDWCGEWKPKAEKKWNLDTLVQMAQG